MSSLARSQPEPHSTTYTTSPPRLLVVDDDPIVTSRLDELLSRSGFSVITASDGKEALSLAKKSTPDIVITDLKMPRMDGTELVHRLHDQQSDMPVLVLSGVNDLDTAVAAMRAGAADYVTKPFEFKVLQDRIVELLEMPSFNHTERSSSLERVGEERRPAPSDQPLGALHGNSAAMRTVYGMARQVAPSSAVVLITGESGTGKSALAQAIHEASGRHNKPFVTVHAAALVDSLLESELFGHERGAFTGADRKRLGRFEEAEGGTLFLDEVGDISQSTQVKLLRVLQERTFERVGGNQPVRVDVRLIAATSQDLAVEVNEGRFREDFYYRLNVVHIDMPPLRQRGDDVKLLANEFLKRFAEANDKQIDGFTRRAERRILQHPWPGNVRELENTIHRAVVLCNGSLLDEPHLSLEDGLNKGRCARTLAEIEREAILSTLESVAWSTPKAAEILGISVRTIQYRLNEYGVSARGRKKGSD